MPSTLELGRFKSRVDTVVDEIRTSRRAAGTAALHAPGDLELQTAARNRDAGIPLNDTTLSAAQVYLLRRERKFPDPATLGPGVRAWPDILVDAWLGSRIEARSAMVSLTAPVELPLWTPELERRALDNAPRGVQMIRRQDVLLRVSVRKTKLYDLIDTDGFPWPVPIGICARAWIAQEVDDWLRVRYERRCARDPGFAFLTGRRSGSPAPRRSANS
ncbi:MAG: AlpA family phage regulatory protein [Immundisolibacterales bacterium]|nr:AlpA family phage regulatory protein [Immundisolibacterales bacterium]